MLPDKCIHNSFVSVAGYPWQIWSSIVPWLCKSMSATFCSAHLQHACVCFPSSKFKWVLIVRAEASELSTESLLCILKHHLRRKQSFYVASAYQTAAGLVADFQITLEQLAVRLFLGNIPLLMNTAPEGIA